MSVDVLLKDLNLKFSFGDDLKEKPEAPKDVLEAISRLQNELKSPDDFTHKVRVLGQLGSFCRSMRMLDEAGDYFHLALEEIKKRGLNEKMGMANRIRQAHVFQWKEDFENSNKLFEKIIRDCESDPDFDTK